MPVFTVNISKCLENGIDRNGQPQRSHNKANWTQVTGRVSCKNHLIATNYIK